MIDYHIHTRLCRHAQGELNEYIEQAIISGIEEIAITDHNPLPGNFDMTHRMAMSEMEVYLKWIDQARSAYPEIKILTGIEADYIEGFEDYLQIYLDRFSFDVVLMSIHFIRHWENGNWVFNYSFPGRSLEEICKDYINAMIAGVRSGLFDVIAHIDLLKKPGESLIKKFPELVDRLLTETKKHEMVVEINTSGFRKTVAETYPGYDWLAAIQAKNIPLCTGSDAHKPEHVAFNFNHTYQELSKLGFSTLTHFEKRSKVQIPII